MSKHKLFYISFATSDGFLGATVMSAIDEEGALAKATHLSLNPGGEAAIIAIPPSMPSEGVAEMLAYENRLVSKAELLSNGAKRVGDMEPEHRYALREKTTFVCESCNDV